MTGRRAVSAHRTLAAAMTEDRGPDSLEAYVREVIADLGLFGYHPRNSKGSAASWPDWVIVGRGGILYRELKSEAGSLSPDQRRVGELITRAGGNWAVWRPTQRLDGTIAKELTGLAAIQPPLFGATTTTGGQQP